jgi:hypothetical protein
VDVVQLTALSISGAALIPIILKILPQFLAARRSSIKITVEIGKNKLTLEQGNAAEAENLIRALLDSLPARTQEDSHPAGPQEDPGADG